MNAFKVGEPISRAGMASPPRRPKTCTGLSWRSSGTRCLQQPKRLRKPERPDRCHRGRSGATEYCRGCRPGRGRRTRCCRPPRWLHPTLTPLRQRADRLAKDLSDTRDELGNTTSRHGQLAEFGRHARRRDWKQSERDRDAAASEMTRLAGSRKLAAHQTAVGD